MQTITGRTLENLKRILDAEGQAAQVTEFTDGILNQTVDVSRMLPGTGQNDGWVSLRNLHSHVANGNLFSVYDPYVSIIEANALPVSDFRVWVLNADLFRQLAPADGEISGMMVGLRVRGLELGVANVTSFSASPLESGGTHGPQLGSSGFSSPVPFRNIPMLLQPGGDALLQRSSAANIAAAGPASAAFHWLLWIGPRGLNPPGIA